MEKSKDVLLASTLHDPRGVFSGAIENAARIIKQNYSGWVINLTTTTDPDIRQTLQAMASYDVYTNETTQQIVADKIENDHLNLLQKVLYIMENLQIKKIQYTDGDRMITAATHFPRDLCSMSERASALTLNSLSYLNFRRSPKDFFAHHPPLVQTECEFNRLYSEAFGMPIDIGSTSHVMSVDVLKQIISRSPHMESVSFPHPKWLIIAKEMDARIQSEETDNVLTFETPDQFKKEVLERINNNSVILDPYERLQKVYMATLGLDNILSEQEWSLRFHNQRQYITLLQNHLPAFGFDQAREASLVYEINSTLVNMEIKQREISKTLHKFQPN